MDRDEMARELARLVMGLELSSAQSYQTVLRAWVLKEDWDRMRELAIQLRAPTGEQPSSERR